MSHVKEGVAAKGTWAKHLRPDHKKFFHRMVRKARKQCLKDISNEEKPNYSKSTRSVTGANSL